MMSEIHEETISKLRRKIKKLKAAKKYWKRAYKLLMRAQALEKNILQTNKLLEQEMARIEKSKSKKGTK